jgi:MFS family permease
MAKIITRPIILLSLVSLFADIASEMLYPVMPLYLKSIGFSVALIGVLEGVAEATAGLSKAYFGKLSDTMGKRLPFVQLGYALSAISKPLMGMFIFPLWVFFSRTLDRLGKGIRTGARDSMLSDETTKENKGKVFGFHRSLDTFGAVLGPICALIYLKFYPAQYQTLFFLAFIPGIVVIGLTFLIKEKKYVEIPTKGIEAKPDFSFFSFLSYWKQSPLLYKRVTGALLVFALFNSSDIFLLLIAKQRGLSDSNVLYLYIFYNIIYALASYPLGSLADKVGFRTTLIFGLAMFTLTYLGVAYAEKVTTFYTIFFFYGLYAAATEGVAKAWISNIADAKDTATAIGTFAGFSSLAALVASSWAGFMWSQFSPQATFISTAIIAGLVMVYFSFLEQDIKNAQNTEGV